MATCTILIPAPTARSGRRSESHPQPGTPPMRLLPEAPHGLGLTFRQGTNDRDR